jgi:hypothetical protein
LKLARELNPLTSVDSLTKDIIDFSPEELTSFSLIILCNATPLVISIMSRKLRALHVPHIVLNLFAYTGVMFSDFLDHKYIVETSKENASGISTSTIEQNVISFPSFDSLCSRKWIKDPKLLKKMPHLLKYHAWITYVSNSDRKFSSVEEHLEYLQTIAKIRSEAEGFELDKVMADTFLLDLLSNFKTEMSAVAAIVGGLASAEAIKVISGKDAPLMGVIIFDGSTGGAAVCWG